MDWFLYDNGLRLERVQKDISIGLVEEIILLLKTTNMQLHVMLCAIWPHLYNLKNVKNTHGGVLLLVKLQALPNRATHHRCSILQKISDYFSELVVM